MRLVFESHDDVLKLTGVSARLVEPVGGEPAALIVSSMIVSNKSREPIQTSVEDVHIPLTTEWFKAISAENPGRDDRVILTLEKARPSNNVDGSLMDILSNAGNSLYEIKDMRVQPKSVIIFG